MDYIYFFILFIDGICFYYFIIQLNNPKYLFPGNEHWLAEGNTLANAHADNYCKHLYIFILLSLHFIQYGENMTKINI